MLTSIGGGAKKNLFNEVTTMKSSRNMYFCVAITNMSFNSMENKAFLTYAVHYVVVSF